MASVTFDFFLCECGKAHLRGARYCDRCGAQPPRKVATGRQGGSVDVPEEDVSEFVAACVAIGQALERTGGKWGCA